MTTECVMCAITRRYVVMVIGSSPGDEVSSPSEHSSS